MEVDKKYIENSREPVNILAIDDEPSLIRILKDILGTNNMTLISASSAEEAYQKLNALKPTLILLDLMLPDENGLNICRYIKTNKKTRHIPVIIVSVKASEKDKIDGFEMGADDYITKPFSSAELKARIRSVLRSYTQKNQPPTIH